MRKAIYAAMVLFAACQKKADMVPDASKVTMDIQSPNPGQTFRSGDTVYIKAGLIYQGELHGYEVKIVDTASGFIVYDNARHVHTDRFDINDKWVCTTTQPSGLKLIIIANIDHNGEVAQKEMMFEINP
jgi:hypothetical protein